MSLSGESLFKCSNYKPGPTERMLDSTSKVLQVRTFECQRKRVRTRNELDSSIGSGRNQRLSQPQKSGHGQNCGTASRGINGSRFCLNGTATAEVESRVEKYSKTSL